MTEISDETLAKLNTVKSISIDAATGEPAAGGGDGGGPVTVADGADVAQGAVADAAAAAGGAGTVSAKLRKISADIASVLTAVQAATPGGDNNIGNVDIVTVPADPFGTTADASVASGASGSISAKLRRATQGLEDLKSLIVLAAGNNNIGNVDVETLAVLIAGEDLTGNVLGSLTKPVIGSAYAPGTYQEAGSVTKANIKSVAGNVYFIRVTNTNAAVRYFQLHNKSTAPAAAETAQLSFLVPAGTATAPGILMLGINELASSEYFSTGIGWAISTTDTTFTDSATASEHKKTIRYM